MGVAVDYEFDAAVALAASAVSLEATGCVLPKPRAVMVAGGDAFFGEVIADGVAERRSESCWVEVVGADAVGVAFDLEDEAFVGQEDAGNFGELFAVRPGLEGRGAYR